MPGFQIFRRQSPVGQVLHQHILIQPLQQLQFQLVHVFHRLNALLVGQHQVMGARLEFALGAVNGVSVCHSDDALRARNRLVSTASALQRACCTAMCTSVGMKPSIHCMDSSLIAVGGVMGCCVEGMRSKWPVALIHQVQAAMVFIVNESCRSAAPASCPD